MQCKVGYAGNGLECDIDTDVDGIPDADLNCDEKSCKQVCETEMCLRQCVVLSSKEDRHRVDACQSKCFLKCLMYLVAQLGCQYMCSDDAHFVQMIKSMRIDIWLGLVVWCSL